MLSYKIRTHVEEASDLDELAMKLLRALKANIIECDEEYRCVFRNNDEWVRFRPSENGDGYVVWGPATKKGELTDKDAERVRYLGSCMGFFNVDSHAEVLRLAHYFMEPVFSDPAAMKKLREFMARNVKGAAFQTDKTAIAAVKDGKTLSVELVFTPEAPRRYTISVQCGEARKDCITAFPDILAAAREFSFLSE